MSQAFKIKTLIKKMDYFGTPPEFRINNKTKFTSLSGGIASVLFFICGIFYSLLSFKYFLNREKMSLIYTNKVLTWNPYINFNGEEFVFAVSLFNNSTTINNYIDIELNIAIHNIIDENEEITVPLKKCKIEYIHERFQKMEPFNSHELYEDLYCHNTSQIKLKFEGNYTNDYKIEYKISFKLNNEALKDLIKSRDFINSNFVPKIFFLNTKVDYDNIDYPLEKFIDGHYLSINFDTYKKLEISISTLEFSSDESWLFNNPNKVNTNIVQYTSEHSLFIKDRKIITGSENILADVIIFPSDTIYILKRTFEKLPEFLAGVSGLLSQILITLFIYFSFFNHKKADQKLMQKTLKINSNKHSRLDYLVELFSKVEKNKLNSSICSRNSESEINKQNPISSILNSIKNISISDLKEKDFIELDNSPNKSYLSISKIKNFDSNRDDNLKPIDPEIYIYPVSFSENQIHNDNSNRINKRTRKLFSINNKRQSNIQIDANQLNNIKNSKTENVFNRNMCQILFSYLNCCSAKWKNKFQILKEGEKKIYFYMDVLTYLRKMQEIDIMKYLLMSKDELRLFNFLCKPYLNSNNIKSKIHLEYLKEEKQSFSLGKEEVEKILDSYQNLLAKDNLNDNEMKIIELFEEEVNNINNSIN